MKPISFNYCEYVALKNEADKRNAYTEALQAERDQARLDCAIAERNHMNTLERFLEAQERITELTAERDALLKSVKALSAPIEVIQPRGITE